MLSRTERLLGDAAKDRTLILEIGPCHAPIAPKAAGWKTHVVDHTDQAGLCKKYRASDVDLAAIEPVDSIWTAGRLDAAVPEQLHGCFDRLIASHVIEHLPDPAGFLAAAGRLLRPDGVVALAIPDKRFCFDYFRPSTTTGEVLEAFFAGRSRHPARSLWNHLTTTISMGGVGAWGQHAVSVPAFLSNFGTPEAARACFAGGEGAAYEDCHAWVFTPAGFALLMLDLGQLGVTEWRIESLDGPAGCEFFAMLRRGVGSVADPAILQTRRIALLREQLAELGEQISFAEAGGLLPNAHARSGAVPPGVADATMMFLHHEHRLSEVERRVQRLYENLAPLAALLRRLGLRRR